MELEALASRKFTEYYRYRDLHKKLRDVTSTGEAVVICRQLIDSYIDNRMIWKELDYFKSNNAILGKHPVFDEFNRRKKLSSLSVKELCARLRQVSGNIWRVKSELAKGNRPHLDVERKNRLLGYEKELEDINRLLNG